MKLHVAASGHGAPLVMLHGWALDGGVFDPLAEALGGEFRCIRIDLPGHGRSPTADSTAIEDWAAAIAADVPHGALLLGWSLGGQIALALAAAQPQRLAGLLLVCTTPRFVADAQWTQAVAAETLGDFATRLGRDYRTTIDGFLALQVHGDARALAALRALRRHVRQAPAPSARSLSDGLALLEQTDLRSRLGDLAVPALVLSGGRDRLCPPAAGRFLAERLADAHYVEIARAAHAPFVSHPAEFEACVREFARRRLAAGAPA